jgi:peptide/nickel transport system ATP-binding protein
MTSLREVCCEDVAPMSGPVLEVTDLVKNFTVKSLEGVRAIRSTVQAVSSVSFVVESGQTLGLVGESGSGKSTVGRCVLRLIEPTSGSVKFMGTELTTLDPQAMRALRRELQIVFQDPYASLDPRMTVGSAITEPFQIHKIKGNHKDKVAELLNLVGLAPDHARRFPHEFSGGQRQRIGVARALALEPSLIILDEPVSALDVSIQAGVVNLLQDLQDRLGLSYVFIAHDLSVVRHISNVVAVMYLGKLVEMAPSERIYTQAAHPYTQALLSAIPEPDPVVERQRQRIVLTGDPPSPIDPPTGCRFRTRCWKAQELCAQEEPALVDRGQGHPVACHFPEIIAGIAISAEAVDEPSSDPVRAVASG